MADGPGSGAYRTLHLDTSRTRTQFADFPMPDDWPDYPRHDRILGYLTDYADHFGLRPAIRHGHVVTGVRRSPDGDWSVTASGPAGPVSVRTSAVVVASGHNSVPRSPDPVLAGLTSKQLHSHDYREPAQLAGQRVLVVGGGNSAMDIAADAAQVAERTILSLRRGVWVVPKYLFGRPSDTLNGALAKRLPWRLRQVVSQATLRLAAGDPRARGLPAPAHGFLQDHPTLSDLLLTRVGHGDIAVRGAIAGADGAVVEFADGRRDEVDLVVWCTGYRAEIPFLDPPAAGDRVPLYRHVFHLDEPGLFLVGLMQSTGAALPIVEAQARLVAAHLAGDHALPTPAEQRADRAARLRRAHQRWGDRRTAMRIDFDAYLALAADELRQGRRRRARGRGVAWTEVP
ncbi:NAD(P)-binding domain-containing protein [Asanoa sp. WMMD1127]|uniref:flavin-containing monooxygenase n=1 Tax=Asanoa sp. WMMD1127 TaxID=3016107 RepID=UPI002416EC60|nr:NAD(P)-binding domain-containing protein [Asanoa sp. WMMD1127]MDG4825357.1 NAD(P)-binding domain-containing protein [Asanoa sp. WMMD1127]